MKTVLVAWAFFLITGVFVGLVVPLGEGFDEPWHFGYIQYVAQTHRLPPGPHLHLSTELETFLRIHPMGWRIQQIFRDLQPQETYWSRSDSDRRATDNTIRSLHFSGTYTEATSAFTEQYESHQAPLYYAVSALLFQYFSRMLSFADTFLLIRIWSVVLASTVVPLSYALTKRVSSSHLTPRAVVVLVAMFPGLYPDVARVSNDALMVPLAAATFVALCRYVDSRSSGNMILIGILLVAGLSTKALFVPIAIAVLLIVLGMKAYRAAGILVVASAAGCIWYVRNAFITGSATGLPETVSAHSTVLSSIRSVTSIHWPDVLKLAAVSHIWMGNWSLLQYRSWMYETIGILFLVGILGFLLHLIRSQSGTLISLCIIYVTYCLALAYYATQIAQETGVPVIQGWYLSPMLPIEAVAFALGIEFLLRRWSNWAMAFAATCFFALIIYGNVFIAAPYYSGVIEHAPSGHLRAYHPHGSDISLITSRLTRFHPFIPTWLPLLLLIALISSGSFLIWNLCRPSE